MKNSIKTMLDSYILDNASYIKENGGNVAEYIIETSKAEDQGWLWFLSDEEINEYEESSIRRNELIEEIESYVNENYNYNIKAQELLEKWIVVSFPDADHDDAIRVTRRSNFETMNFCDAYGNYGQQVGCDAAGCYCFSNTECSIFLDFSKELYNLYPEIESIVNENEMTDREFCEFFIDSMNHKPGKDLFSSDRFDKMFDFFKTWREANETHTEVTGWTYHDSHNFKTVVSKADFCEPDCTELDEDEQIEILLQMPETAPHIEGTNTSEESEDFLFHFDRWATNPWFCFVQRK